MPITYLDLRLGHYDRYYNAVILDIALLGVTKPISELGAEALVSPTSSVS